MTVSKMGNSTDLKQLWCCGKSECKQVLFFLLSLSFSL